MRHTCIKETMLNFRLTPLLKTAWMLHVTFNMKSSAAYACVFESKQHSTGTGTFNNKYIIIIIQNILPFAIGSNSLAYSSQTTGANYI